MDEYTGALRSINAVKSMNCGDNEMSIQYSLNSYYQVNEFQIVGAVQKRPTSNISFKSLYKKMRI